MVATTAFLPVSRSVSSYVEALKYLGLSLMLVFHWFLFVEGYLPDVLVSLGTLVFPSFVLALALVLGRADGRKLFDVSGRLFSFSAGALVLQVLVRDPLPINVLFTFACGVSAFWWYVETGSFLGLFPALVFGFFGEYSVVGVALVFSTLFAVRSGEWYLFAVPLALLLPLSVFLYLNLWFLAFPLVAALVWFLPIRLPRVRGLFLALYVAQWPVLWVAQQVF